MRSLTGNEVAAVSGGDVAELLALGLALGIFARFVLDSIAGSQPDGTQMGDIQAP
jgi:hypothetical protein